jgi:uncharacterized membrane protein
MVLPVTVMHEPSSRPASRRCFITIGTPTLVQAALAETLSVATAPIDSLLYNTLMLLGIKVGEADVRVTDLRCMNPALVQ